MSQKANYFKTGLFVILAFLLLAGAIILFGGGKFLEEKYTVETYFDQSVQGLDVGAALKFQGVQIGNVSHIGFVFNEYKTDYQYVLIRAEIFPNKVHGKGNERVYQGDFDRKSSIREMIRKGLRLQLASQGVTGIAFLNAVYFPPERYPPLEINWTPEYQYIPSAPGTITMITQTIEKLTTAIEKINFQEISEDIEKLVNSLNEAVEQAEIGELSKDLQQLVTTLDKTTNEIDSILKSKETKETVANISQISTDLKFALRRADRLLSSREHNIKTTMENVERISEDVREFMETVKKYPSWVLFGNPPPHFGEEEKAE
ncbi:MAG: MlaD family protein [Deltaproteobacteria bacterium]